MAKRKNKDAVKRRESKKHRNSTKRKAQVYSKPSKSIPADYPDEYLFARKLSDVIFSYAEPLINAAGDNKESEKKAIIISISLWNASLLPKQKALESLEPEFEDMAKDDQQLKNGLYTMFEMMYNRKQNLYYNDKRFIVDYSLSLQENNEGYYLQVASIPLKT